MKNWIAPGFRFVVIQLNSYCNCKCEYCYLDTVDIWKRLRKGVLEAIIDAINLQGENVQIIWHAGEPLAAGKYLRSAIELVDKECHGLVTHYIQTNGTLITDEWCKFFILHNVKVGLSIDGPEWANTHRVDKNKQPIFSRVMRGAELLNSHQIEYTVICVVSDTNVSRPRELYEFFRTLGCVDVGINFVELEKEGVVGYLDDDRATAFWKELFQAWSLDKSVGIREFRKIFGYFSQVLNKQTTDFTLDPFPTIDVEGNVYLISPELAGKKSERYNDFVAGNVLQERLGDIVNRASEVRYIAEFMSSMDLCQATCPFFSPCKGGNPINKLFEGSGDLATTTVTSACRNALIKPMNVIISTLEGVPANE